MQDFSFKPVREEFKHEGTVISIDLRPLKVKAMAKLLPVIESMEKNKGEGEEKSEDKNLHVGQVFALFEAAEPVLKEHATNIRGFTIDGNPPTWDRICEEMSMVPLVSAVINKLFEMSTPEDKVAEGN